MPHVYPGTPQQNTTLYYSFELGPVTFLMLGSYSCVLFLFDNRIISIVNLQ
jgi:hypothetical protein